MSETDDEVRRFIRAVHRRWAFWRAVERVGLGTALASAVALPLVLLVWLQGGETFAVAGTVLAGGAAIGLVIGLVRRPSPRDAAVEADRQFRLHDLLATAILLPSCRHVDESWKRTVLALARARCRTLSPNDLVLNRLGARAWGGISLAAALVLTVSLMTAAPQNTRAGDASADRRVHAHAADRSLDASAGARAFVARPSLDRSPRAAADVGSRDDQRTRGTPGGSDTSPALRPAADPSNPSSETGDSSAAGTGAAQTRVAPRSADLRADPQGFAEDEGGAASAAGGIPRGPAEDIEGGSPAGGTNDAFRAVDSLAPWHSPAWPAAQEAAIASARAGQLPAEYRELVRSYFLEDANERP